MSAAPLLDEKILAIREAFVAREVPHAFGGALALAYWATPRGTVDIDVNVFVGVDEAQVVLDVLAGLGAKPRGRTARRRLRESGQIRLYWGHTPVDVFFAYDPLHASCLERSRVVPFGEGAELRVLGPENLVIFKVLFDRPKDWLDVRELLFAQAGDFDARYALDWLSRILPDDDARLERFRALLEAPGPVESQAMFDLDPGEDLDLLVETARSFAADRLAPHVRAAEAARGVDPAVRAAFTQIGLAGLELPEALGGAGLGSLARALVNEELGAADPGAALALDPLGPAAYALAEAGGDEALRAHAAALLEQEGARALLVTPGETRLAGDQRTVSGVVPWVPAERVDLLLLLDDDGVRVIRDGIAVQPLPGAGLRAAGAAELRLDDAPVVASWRDPAAAARALARARLYVTSLLVGVLRQAAEFSREYALERHAFGRPIAHHQALAFLITDMRMAVDGARLLLHEAAWHADRHLPCEALAAAAFAEAVEASRLVAPNGVQILGGHGFMQDYPVEKYMREARTLGLMLGGVDAAREQAGRALCDAGAPIALSHAESA